MSHASAPAWEPAENAKSEDREATYVVLPALAEGRSVVLFSDGSFCRDWVPRV